MLKWNIAGLLWLDVGRADNLAPLLDFRANESPEIGGRAGEHCCAQVPKPRLHLGVSESRIDLPVELLDNLGRRLLGGTDTLPNACFQAGHEIANGWNLRQGWRAGCGGYG